MEVELETFLNNAGLEKYIPILVKEEVRDLETLKALDQNDLAAMGIAVGSRKKILLEINKLNAIIGENQTLREDQSDDNYSFYESEDQPVQTRFRALSTILREKWVRDNYTLTTISRILHNLDTKDSNLN